MRSAAILKLATAIALSLVVVVPALHKHSINIATETLQRELNSTLIDMDCSGAAPAEVFRLLRQELVRKNPYFNECQFEYHEVSRAEFDDLFPERNNKISWSLRDCPGIECLYYLSEQAWMRADLRPRKIIVKSIYDVSDERDILERAYDTTADACNTAWNSIKVTLGMEAPPPPFVPGDPFAPSP